MALPWVRVDANVAQHDKMLALKADPSPRKWQAIASYFFGLGWSGGQGTDGFIPSYALESVHGTPQTARLLVKYRLWEEGVGGYQIRNYETRQELTIITDSKRAERSASAQKANCVRWHGADCGCWKQLA
jgi:hypothetical protein